MKKILTLLLFCSIIFSCENSTNSINSLEGKWNVTQIMGGLSQPVSYEIGDVSWFFNFDNKTITIANNIDVFNSYFIPSFSKNQSGIYPFEIITENNTDYLLVEDRKGAISFNQEDLMIDYGIEADEIAFTFNR